MSAGRREILLRLLFPWLGALCVALDIGRVVPGPWPLLVSGLTAAVGVAVAELGHRRRWALPAGAALVALAVVVVVAVAGSAPEQALTVPSPARLWTAAQAVVEGWSQVLSASVPLAWEPATATVLLMTVAFAAWVGATAAARSDNALLPGLVQVPFLAVAEMIAAPVPYEPLPTVGFALVVVLGTLGRARPPAAAPDATPPTTTGSAAAPAPGAAVGPAGAESGGAGRRGAVPARLLAGLVIATVATVGATVLIRSLSPARLDDPFDPRSVTEPPERETTLLHPLARLKAELAAEDRQVFELTAATPLAFAPGSATTTSTSTSTSVAGSAATAGGPTTDAPSAHIQLVALDTYDGAAWQLPSGLVRVVGELPAPSTGGGAQGVQIEERIALGDLGSPWLPSLGRPDRVRFDRRTSASYDAELGNLLTTDGSAAPGLTYRLSSTVALPTAEELRTASSTVTGSRFVALPNSAAALLAPVVAAVPSGGTSYERLTSLAERLRNGYAYDPANAPVGHSLGQLRQFLEGKSPGSAEQFATMFTLAARQLGFPSRVVVGYRVDATTLAAGQPLAVSSRSLHAWPEVFFDELGWVPLEPTPEQIQSMPPRSDLQQTQTSALGGESLPDQALEQARIDQDPPEVPEDGLASWVGTALRVLLLAALLALLVGAIPLAKAVRRRRRQRGTPSAWVLGAWAEARDRLTEHGLAVLPGATARELAVTGGDHLGEAAGRPLDALAPLVGMAVYRPAGPSAEGAGEAWKAVGDLRVALAERCGTGRRVRAASDPRPLIGRRASRHRSSFGDPPRRQRRSAS